MEKVLIITYYWPPGSGAGVQRWLKFSKYLPSFGWKPVILTIDPAFATYPALDNSMETEISNDLEVYKTRATDYFRIYNKDKRKIPSAGFASNEDSGIKGKILRFIRGNLFIPDPRKGWNKFAFRKACQIIDNEEIHYVITTSPPHSTQLIGLKLKKKYPGINWIADLRDPWTDIYYYNQFYPTFISKMIDRKYENQVLQAADKIITVGNSLKNAFAAKHPGINDKIEVITNGFDKDDFEGFTSVIPESFTISYIGTLSGAYPISGFMNAFSTFAGKYKNIKLRFIGTISPGQEALILSESCDSSIEFIPYVNHKDAIKYMMESSILLLIIPDHRSNKSIITGKLFEYIASGKPVICLGPEDGDAAEIIRVAGNGNTYNYYDNSGIAAFLNNMIKNPGIYSKNSSFEFSRKILTSRLVSILSGM